MCHNRHASHLNPGEPVGDFKELQSRLGYIFRNLSLLKLALTHPSIAQDHTLSPQHNQRLEFLGDAVLQLVLTHALYERFPDLDERDVRAVIAFAAIAVD